MSIHRAAKRWLPLGCALLLGLVSLPLLLPEIRSFLLFQAAPEYARDAHFLRMRNGDQVVYLLGTIHKDHCTSAAYSFWHFGAVIDQLRPDLLLVESRPEELARDNWGDGPVEMPFARMTARDPGVAVGGIDWWEPARHEQPGARGADVPQPARTVARARQRARPGGLRARVGN